MIFNFGDVLIICYTRRHGLLTSRIRRSNNKHSVCRICVAFIWANYFRFNLPEAHYFFLINCGRCVLPPPPPLSVCSFVRGSICNCVRATSACALLRLRLSTHTFACSCALPPMSLLTLLFCVHFFSMSLPTRSSQKRPLSFPHHIFLPPIPPLPPPSSTQRITWMPFTKSGKFWVCTWLLLSTISEQNNVGLF